MTNRSLRTRTLTSRDRASAVVVAGGAVLHWGDDPGEVDDGADLAALRDFPVTPSSLDVPLPIRLLPLAADGFLGRPGLEGRRPDGRAAFPRLLWDEAAQRFVDDAVGLTAAVDLALDHTLRATLTVTNDGDQPWCLDRAVVTLPLPGDLDELLRFDGRWGKELQPVRQPWPSGTVLVESRRGRTSHDHLPLLFAGRRGFDETTGEVFGVHVAWSGNTELRVEQLADGRRYLQAGELLLPGEVTLQPGDTYTSPVVHAVHAHGLTAASQRFHRATPTPGPDRPRPVLLNTWEAVYFDHDQATLRSLADRAAAVGVERFVLDDGWFGGRRDDRRGLGDWWVSPDVYPDGLAPLIDHVRSLGMEFGIWVEPEMVNPDSDLHRAHPDWVLGDGTITARHQLVLDLANPDCWAYLHEHLHRLLADHDIAYVKWDMNRDLVAAGAHAQTHALYRLLARLRADHPDVEIESCSSGGGRMDLGVLDHTCRLWTSDCNDATERQQIQRGASHLFPLAVLGAHIGPPRSHTTGRRHRLAYRAATALFGHLGIEWNILDADDRELDALREVVALHQRLRPLLHGGDLVRLDHPTLTAFGVVAPDRDHAVFSIAQVDASPTAAPVELRLHGLDPDRRYTVTHLRLPGEHRGLSPRQPAWFTDTTTATGRALQAVGLQPPVLVPESAILLELT